MAIPNTTPTPNELFNGEMKKMTDAELRVVMIVTRATFGWIVDEEKGLRKEEDWISHSQMVEKSGKSSRAISYAIKSCIEKDWIEARDEEGNLLDTPIKRRRHGKKIFYRLGEKFLKTTIANSAKVNHRKKRHQTIAKNDIKPSQPLRTTKETITKEIYTKEEDEEEVKIPSKKTNPLNLSRGQTISFLKAFPTLTNLEIKDQMKQCNTYMGMSSEEYKNPGLFFRKWLERYSKEKRQKALEEKKRIEQDNQLEDISEGERQKNFKRIEEIRRKFNFKSI